MKYIKLPDIHEWSESRHMSGYRARFCMKCKQLLYFIKNEGVWYVENRKPATPYLIDRELELIDCEKMYNQIRMD